MATKRIKWRDRTPENDIKYGGFLSYRHLRIIGWICLAIAQIGVVLKLEAKLAPDTAATIDILSMVISIFAALPVPLFLLANLSTILQKRGDYKSLFKKYGVMAAGMYLLANLLVFYHGFRFLNSLNPSITFGDALDTFGILLPALGKTGYTLNIFIDMLLVLLMFFFMNYEPTTKAFQGKRVILFRLMFLLPVAYEVCAILVKYHIGMGNFSVPSPVFFLLPSKPPLIFAAFVFVVLGLKIGQVRYLKRGDHTPADYEEHVKTNAHSLKISIAIAIIFVIFAIIDFVLIIGLMITSIFKYMEEYPGLTEDQLEMLVLTRLGVIESIGIGSSVGLLLVAPLVPMFSYTKTHENTKIDTLIPVAGIGLIALILFQGLFEVITWNLSAFLEKLSNAIGEATGGGETEPAAVEAHHLLNWINNVHL